MRRAILTFLGTLLLFPLCGLAQQQPSLAEAARKAREKKKDVPKATKVFTNDSLATTPGRVSVVGTTAAPATEGGEAAAAAEGKPGEKKDEKDEGYWRGRFADARAKVRQAEKELDILQRELNLLSVQYYSDPNEAMREQFERKQINEHRRKIEDKQKEVQQLRQVVTDLEEELRRAGGPPAWGRER